MARACAAWHHRAARRTHQLATADFRSDAFDLSTRPAVTLAWSGYLEPVDLPVRIVLLFGTGDVLGAVTFDKGQVLAGAQSQATAIDSYTIGPPGEGVRHRITRRAGLVVRTCTVRIEEGGRAFTSQPIPFPAGTAAIPVGPARVTAWLTSPKPCASGAYDLSRPPLSGEPK